MQTIHKIFTMVFTVMLFAGFNYAQEVRTLTLDESIKIGLENSHFLRSSRMKVLSAEARASEVNTMRLPSLKFNAAYTRLSPIDPVTFGGFTISSNIENTYTLKLSLQQPIFTGFKLKSSYDAAEYSFEASKEEYSKDEQDLIYNIQNAYWNIYRAYKLKEVVDQNVDQIKAHLDDVQNLFKQGLSTRNDVLKVQVQLADAQLRQIDAKNNVRLSEMSLNNIIGLPVSTEVKITEEAKVDGNPVMDIDALISKAMNNRPDLKAFDFRVKAAESGVTSAQSGWFPQLYLSGNYNYLRPNSRIFPSVDEFKGTWDVTVSLQWDLWTWGAAGYQTDQAQATLEQTKEGLGSLRDAVTLDVTQNYLAIQQASEKISVSENNVKQAEENYRVTNDKFKNGLILNSELLDAEYALLQAKTNYIQSVVDYKLAAARLEKSTGK